MSGRYLVLGLARPRTPWFGLVGRWATSGSAPIEFIRCVSREEVQAQLASGRGCSALLVDGGSHDLDRDLVDLARAAGAATIVVDDGTVRRDWTALGAGAVLPADLSRGDLTAALAAHATPLARGATTLRQVLDGAGEPIEDLAGGGAGNAGSRWISVVGAGAGTSVLAMALAQALGDRRQPGSVVLADLALDADQAMLHAAPDIVPGISELVEAHRAARPAPQQVRDLTFAVDGRHYHLLLGLRRHRDWSALRPRATEAALDGLGRAFELVVADVDGDLEGEDDCGSVEVEERNGLARTAVRRADVVVAVGTGDLKGVHGLVRLLCRLRQFGIPAERLVPVVNRAPRQPRARAELTRAIAGLTGGLDDAGVAGTLFTPNVRRLDAILRDGGRLPDQLGGGLSRAVLAVLDRCGPAGATAEPVAVRPGELGQRRRERAAS